MTARNIPIIIDSDLRIDLRNFMIGQQIYLPIHWPHNSRPHYLQGDSNCYDMELSLICDCRYTPTQLERMMTCIEGFVNQ